MRSSFFFYLSRFHHALHILPLDHDVLAVDPTVNQPATASQATTSSPSSWPRKRLALSRMFWHHIRHPLSWSLLGLHPVRDLLYLPQAFVEFVRHPSIDWGWLRSSIKIALIICVASLIAVIPQIGATTIFPNAFWAAFTAAILTSDSEGALWQVELQRTRSDTASAHSLCWSLGSTHSSRYSRHCVDLLL